MNATDTKRATSSDAPIESSDTRVEARVDGPARMPAPQAEGRWAGTHAGSSTLYLSPIASCRVLGLRAPLPVPLPRCPPPLPPPPGAAASIFCCPE